MCTLVKRRQLYFDSLDWHDNKQAPSWDSLSSCQGYSFQRRVLTIWMGLWQLRCHSCQRTACHGLAVCSPEVILATHMFSSDRVFYPHCSLCSLLRKLAYQSVNIHQLQTSQAYQFPADYTSSLATASSSNPNHHILSTFIDKCVNFFKSQPRHPVSTTYMYNSILNNLHCSVLHLSLTKHPYSSISTSLWTVLATIKCALQSVSNQH